MKKNVFTIMTIFYLLSICSCSSVKVVSDADPTVDWTKYKTFSYYGWAEESNKILNQFDQDRIENAFGEEFKKRGLEFTEKDGDLIVVLFVVVEQKTQQSAHTTNTGGGMMGGYYGDFYDYGPGYGWGGGHSTTTIQNYEYEVGTLVIDVFDTKEKKLVWESIGTGTVDENPQSREEKLPKKVQKIMSKFPIQPKSE